MRSELNFIISGLNGFVVLGRDGEPERGTVGVGKVIYPLPSKKLSPGDRVIFSWETVYEFAVDGEDYVATPETSLIAATSSSETHT